MHNLRHDRVVFCGCGKPTLRQLRQEVMGAAVNKNDAMELVSSAELVDLFSEYYESDKIDMDFLTNDKSCNGDIDFEHAAFTNPGVAAAVPTNTRAELGSNTEDYDIDNMISYD
ncbi:TPA: hypothetical protein ACH3X1_013332 [Trebouxia sp. C0004]